MNRTFDTYLSNEAKNMLLSDENISMRVADLDNSKLPYFGDLNFAFTVKNTSLTTTLQVDASYWFFVFGITIVQPSTDVDVAITSMSINTLTSLIQNPLPTATIIRQTGFIPPFKLTLPANTSFNMTILNGATTDANNMTVTLWGERVPTHIVEDIKGKQRAVRNDN